MAKKAKRVRLAVTLELPPGLGVRGVEEFVREAILTMAKSGPEEDLAFGLRVVSVEREPEASRQEA